MMVTAKRVDQKMKTNLTNSARWKEARTPVTSGSRWTWYPSYNLVLLIVWHPAVQGKPLLARMNLMMIMSPKENLSPQLHQPITTSTYIAYVIFPRPFFVSLIFGIQYVKSVIKQMSTAQPSTCKIAL